MLVVIITVDLRRVRKQSFNFMDDARSQPILLKICKSSVFCLSGVLLKRLRSCAKSGIYRVKVVTSASVCSSSVACSIITSSIVVFSIVERHNDKHSPMMSGGKGTRTINIGRFKTYKVRTKFDNWGRKRCKNPNGSQQFPNWRAKILTGSFQEGSLLVGSVQ
jgi:hypothetical protein